MNSTGLLSEFERYLLARGATLVGCADLRPLPPEVRHDLPVGIAVGVTLAASTAAGLCGGPTKAYAAEYERANAWLDRLGQDGAEFLRERGFRAVAREPTVEALDEKTLATELPHKTVVTRAGIGWIGKGDGIFANTAGIGMLPEGTDVSPTRVVPGDAVVVSGEQTPRICRVRCRIPYPSRGGP